MHVFINNDKCSSGRTSVCTCHANMCCIYDHNCFEPMKRLPVWKGVTATQICEVVRSWLLKQRCSNLANAFGDLAGLHFNLAPRLKVMMRYSDLAKSLIKYAQNGVLSGTCFIDAMWELRRLEPRLENFGSAKKGTSSCLRSARASGPSFLGGGSSTREDQAERHCGEQPQTWRERCWKM